MQIKLENCPVCQARDWKNLDYLRNQKYWYDRDFLYDEPVGFKICKECGFVTYDYVDDETLSRRYNDLVKVVDINSIVTKNRKLQYHKKFLEDIDIKNYVLDYGAASGYFLKYLKDKYNTVPFGVESNEVLRKYSKFEYGIELNTEIPDKQFDFICSYHTFEHVQYPDKLLKEFREHLTDDGYLYMSVPLVIQEDILDEASGSVAAEFEELYHLNHVNMFSKRSFKNILMVNGFDIVKENKEFYGYTVLCKKAVEKEIVREKYNNIVTIIEKQKKATELYKQEKWQDAINAHAGYPDAWCMNAIKNYKDLPKQEEVLKEALTATKGHYKIKKQLAFLYFQWDQNKKGEHNVMNHIRESKRLWEELIQEKPGMEDFYYYLAIIEMKWLKNYKRVKELFEQILIINPSKWGEIQNLTGLMHKERS